MERNSGLCARLTLLLALLLMSFTAPVYGFHHNSANQVPQSVRARAFSRDAVRPKALTQHGGSSTKVRAWPLGKDPKGMPQDYAVAVTRVGITAAATILTWYAHAQQKRCTNVLASAAVTLVSSLVAPGLGQAAMCGSFAGMSSTAVIPDWKYALGLGAVTSFLFETLIHKRNAFLGLGGRLGLLAFIAANVMALIQGVSTGISGVAPMTADAVKSAPMAVMIGFHMVGSVATIVLREASDDNAAADPVRAAAVIGLLGALMVGFGGFSEVGALAVYGGAFVGMSLPSRLLHGIVPGKKPEGAEAPAPPTVAILLASFACAGALGGIVHALTMGWGWWAGGWGGKAGFCSFLGILVYRALSKGASQVCKS